MGSGLPGVLEVHANIALAGVPPNQSLLLELRWFPRQEIAQRQSRVLSSELKLAGGVCSRQIIGCGMNVINPKSELMPSARPTHVFGKLKRCRIGSARRGSWGPLEEIGGSRNLQERNLRVSRRIIKILYA